MRHTHTHTQEELHDGQVASMRAGVQGVDEERGLGHGAGRGCMCKLCVRVRVCARARARACVCVCMRMGWERSRDLLRPSLRQLDQVLYGADVAIASGEAYRAPPVIRERREQTGVCVTCARVEHRVCE